MAAADSSDRLGIGPENILGSGRTVLNKVQRDLHLGRCSTRKLSLVAQGGVKEDTRARCVRPKAESARLRHGANTWQIPAIPGFWSATGRTFSAFAIDDGRL